MNKIIGLGLIVIALTSFNIKNEGNNIIPFSKDSIKLNKSTISKLESYYADIKLCDSLKLEKIVLVNYTCSYELKKNSSIGFLRAKAIIDFYETKYKFRRDLFCYVDVRTSQIMEKFSCDDYLKNGSKNNLGIGIRFPAHNW
jgi:hypothetical protein